MIKLLLCITAFSPCTLAFIPGAFRSSASRPGLHMALGHSGLEGPSVSRGELLKQVGIGAAAALSTAAALPLDPALASDALAATSRSYFRYVPRIQEAMQWYQDELQKAVLAEDWPQVLSFFEVTSTASSYSQKPSIYQSSSSRFERELFSPLSVWAQSFAIKGTGPKLRALLEQEDILEASMKKLEKAAKGKGLKDGQTQAQAAKAAWVGGRDAIQEFIDIANKGMPRQLNKVETPFPKKS